jgi:hypothetical protein
MLQPQEINALLAENKQGRGLIGTLRIGFLSQEATCGLRATARPPRDKAPRQSEATAGSGYFVRGIGGVTGGGSATTIRTIAITS